MWTRSPVESSKPIRKYYWFEFLKKRMIFFFFPKISRNELVVKHVLASANVYKTTEKQRVNNCILSQKPVYNNNSCSKYPSSMFGFILKTPRSLTLPLPGINQQDYKQNKTHSTTWFDFVKAHRMLQTWLEWSLFLDNHTYYKLKKKKEDSNFSHF